MTYLEEFRTQINNRDFPKFLELWEEYCVCDTVDVNEFATLLTAIKNSDFAKPFGKFIETALNLWQKIQNKDDSYRILKLLIDLETTNTVALADIAFQAIKAKYENDPQFNERIRLIGLRSRESFQGALANYDLLAHLEKGKFVLHTGGLGAGEIIDLSPLRQQLTVEFENATGLKHLTFENAFKTLVPLADSSFLARRFADADTFEKDARQDPISVIKLLLKDLGPKTASEIKDELCGLVIPENDWAKWWQSARSKIKKDSMIEAPATIRDCFSLRQSEISQEERLHKAIHKKTTLDEIILTSYNFIRDLPNVKKNQEVRNSVKDKLVEHLLHSKPTVEQELQIVVFLESQFSHEVSSKKGQDLIQQIPNIEDIINNIDIVALKKRTLVLVHEQRQDWMQIFLSMLFNVKQGILRDYILGELLASKQHQAETLNALKNLSKNPEKHPEAFLWYFQKILNREDEQLPFSNKEGEQIFFEAFFILFNHLETKPDSRDLTKKMYSILSGKRYATVRSILEGSSIEFVKEILLLASKCQTLSDHDTKILRSLAEVVYPELANKNKQNNRAQDDPTIWTTEAGYLRIQDQIRQIGTTEIVETAREIEAARALGDLRENSEYKFALEKRSRLQGQLKTLSDQLSQARIITKDDVPSEEIGIGSVVEVLNSQGKKDIFIILGPWDADVNQNILSFQSKLAQSLIGSKPGDKVQFRDEALTITGIKSYFE